MNTEKSYGEIARDAWETTTVTDGFWDRVADAVISAYQSRNGTGWRLLEVGERLIAGDQYFSDSVWVNTGSINQMLLEGDLKYYPYRRRITLPPAESEEVNPSIWKSRYDEMIETCAHTAGERDGFKFALDQERNIHMTTIAERDRLQSELEKVKGEANPDKFNGMTLKQIFDCPDAPLREVRLYADVLESRVATLRAQLASMTKSYQAAQERNLSLEKYKTRFEKMETELRLWRASGGWRDHQWFRDNSNEILVLKTEITRLTALSEDYYATLIKYRDQLTEAKSQRDLAEETMAKLIVKDQPSPWIACKDRMPTKEDCPNFQFVLGFNESGEAGLWHIGGSMNLLRKWMPIPPLPPEPEPVDEAEKAWFSHIGDPENPVGKEGFIAGFNAARNLNQKKA